MSRCIDIGLVAVITLITLTTTAFASEPPQIRHNPFARPPSEAFVDRTPTSVNDESGDSALDLRATMVGTSDRLANVAGRTVRAGDEIQGFVLLHVHEDHAIFIRNGKRRTVYVKPDLEEDDD